MDDSAVLLHLTFYLSGFHFVFEVPPALYHILAHCYYEAAFLLLDINYTAKTVSSYLKEDNNPPPENTKNNMISKIGPS
ncbi:MAG: hypothetical protein WAZ77_14080 [Candidatus Nitrosopolaris sp.]